MSSKNNDAKTILDDICLKKGRMPFLPFASKKVFLRECSDCKKWKAKKAGEEALCWNEQNLLHTGCGKIGKPMCKPSKDFLLGISALHQAVYKEKLLCFRKSILLVYQSIVI